MVRKKFNFYTISRVFGNNVKIIVIRVKVIRKWLNMHPFHKTSQQYIWLQVVEQT